MTDGQYKLYVAKGSSCNQLVGYPFGFCTSRKFHRLVGAVNLPEGSISKLYSFEDRWESGVVLYLPEGMKQRRDDFSDEIIEDMRHRHDSEMELEMIRGAVGMAFFMDVDLYFGKRKISYDGGDSNLVLCSDRGRSIKDVLSSDENNLFDGGFSKVGSVSKVPVGVLMKQDRFVVDSCRYGAMVGGVEPQISIPHESMLNHDWYGLGRYDK